MIYPSKLGLSLIGLCFMLYLVSLQSKSGLLFLILGILFGCYLINLVSAYHGARYLRLFPPDTMTGLEGEPVRGTWEVSNPSKGTVGLTEVRVTDVHSAEAANRWWPLPFGTVSRMLFRTGVVAPGEQIHITPEITFPRRGVYPFANLTLLCNYPFGLIRCRRSLAISGEFIIYPRPYECPTPRAAGFEPMVGGKFAGQNRSSSGDRFHGVRPLQPTDPVKLVHWASSAKGMGLMVKEFDEELSGRVALIMDAEPDAAPAGDNGDQPELLLDWAARAVASLVLAALDQGHQVEFVELAALEPLSVPPFADGGVVMERLARLTPAPGTLTAERLDRAVRALPKKAGLCLVLTTLPEAVAQRLAYLAFHERRVVSVYLPAVLAAGHGLPPVIRVYAYDAHGMVAS
jgi:uncharacterized protein (DUF58 family)